MSVDAQLDKYAQMLPQVRRRTWWQAFIVVYDEYMKLGISQAEASEKAMKLVPMMLRGECKW